MRTLIVFLLSMYSGMIFGLSHSISDPSLTVPCVVTRAIDGDTIELRPDIRFRGRLIGCWVNDGSENDRAAKRYLETLVGQTVTVTVPIPRGDLWRSMTLSRVLVDVLHGDQNVSEHIVSQGWGTETKTKE